jgi:hypothetical protein
MKKSDAHQPGGKPTAKRQMRQPGGAKANVAATLAEVVAVSAEQRRHLIEDAAYFRAERYRPVEPGRYRKQDRRAAEAEIEAVLKKHKLC